MLKFADYFDSKRPKGHAVQIDSIREDDTFAGGYAVRVVVGEWKRPRWLSILWFSEKGA